MLKFVSEEQEMQTKFGNRRLRTAMLADQTATIKMPLWQDNIKKVTPGLSYQIMNALTTTYKNEIQLSSTSNTIFKEVDNLEDAKEATEEIPKEPIKFVGTVQCCKIETNVKCCNCNKSMECEKDGQSTPTIVKCNHCNSKQKYSNANIVKKISLQMINENKEVRKFVAFGDVLNAYIINQSIQNQTDEELETHFLLQPSITINHEENGDMISNIQ